MSALKDRLIELWENIHRHNAQLVLSSLESLAVLPLHMITVALHEFMSDQAVFASLLGFLSKAVPSGEAIKSAMSISTHLDTNQRLELWRTLQECVENDVPDHIRFGGDKDSFIGLTAPMSGCSRGFTVCVWLRLDESVSVKGFLLFRCRCAEGGEDAILSDRRADGTWTLTVRSYMDRIGGAERHEFRASVKLSGGWNYVCFVHDNAVDTCNVVVSVNDVVQFSQPLVYPLSGSHSQCQWALCLGLHGSVASIVAFEGAVPANLLQLLKSLGPYTQSIAGAGVSCPQSSFDSGFMTLGTRLTKGHLASELVRWKCEFFLNALHFAGDGLPAVNAGRIASCENIEMEPMNLLPQEFSPTLSSGCTLSIRPSWVAAWLDAGGCSLVLHMIMKKFEPSAESDIVDSVQEVRRLLSVLAVLLRTCAEMKEQFLQLHGYHILGYGLQSLANGPASVYLDENMVCAIAAVVDSFGWDGAHGDGAAAALQGILLNFPVWAPATLATKAQLLELVNDRYSHNNDISDDINMNEDVYRSIGLQSLLDGMRQYFLYSEIPINTDSRRIAELTRLSGAAYKVMLSCFQAALHFSQQQFSRTIIPRDIEALLACAEEVVSQPLLEVVFKLLSHARRVVPEALLESLCSSRFAETSAIELLSRQDLSAGLRKSVLIMSLWSQSAPLQDSLKSLFSILRRQKELVREQRRLSVNASLDTRRVSQLNSDISAAIRPLEKSWTNMVMLSQLIANNIENGLWDTAEPGSAGGKVSVVNEILSMFFDDGPFGARFDVWLALPLLPPLLAACDLEVFQRVMMSVVVSLKTDDSQVDALCSLPHSFWIGVIVNICMTGDQICFRPDVVDSSSATLNPDGDRSWEYLPSIDAKSRAHTCRELTLDSLATIMDYEMRNNSSEAWNCWICLQTILQTRSSHVGDTASLGGAVETPILCQRRLLLRIVTLVVQRLGRADLWHAGMLAPMLKLLGMIEQKFLRCEELSNSILNRHANSALLDVDFDSPQDIVVSNEEEQLLFFTIDSLSAVRKANERLAFNGQETELMLSGLKIVLCHMQFASERSVDRIANEVLSQLIYLLHVGAGVMHVDQFKEILLQIFHSTQMAVNTTHIPLVRDRLVVMTFTLCHQFIEVRHSLAGGERFAEHVLPAVDAMIGIDTCVDVDVIFRLVDINLCTANSISFEDLPAADDQDATYIAVNPAVGQVSGSATEDHTGFDLLELSSHSGDIVACSNASMTVDSTFNTWVVTRHGIVLERLDTERSRLNKVRRSAELMSSAIDKFWRKLRRKIDSECWCVSLSCQWKLAVAHEGSFPGRRRVVVRPQYEIREPSAWSPDDPNIESLRDNEEDVKRLVASALAGQIKDVRNSDEPVGGGSMENENILDPGQLGLDRHTQSFGNDWGVVGADGSDEGFGVIGLAATAADELESTSAHGQLQTPGGGNGPVHDAYTTRVDQIGGKPRSSRKPHVPSTNISDHKLVDDAIRRGRVIETGPSVGGARRLHHASVSARVTLVTASGNHPGVLYLSRKDLYFASTAPIADGAVDSATVNVNSNTKVRRRRWAVAHISAVYLRRFRLRETAMEVFFKKGRHKHFFVDFGHTTENQRLRNDFARAVMTAAPSSAFKQWQILSQYRLVNEHGVQEKWLNREISNFDYLMALNTISGRSFNDLCQYPVMPWVLKQYTEPTIDLNNSAVYRDLSKPMGALNEARLRDFLDRYESFSESVTMDIPPFMYGSHYSTMPFASLHQEMQNGRFDVSDRLFSSIPRTFVQNTTQLSEVKELTPEWFTTPEMFRNLNHFDLGHTQDGLPVDDVELPPWAKSADEFVRINRDALESEYVSAHLHEWIDLIFGYKQRGPAAVEACNVFYYLTYSGSVNRELIKDDALRKATELQIAHFGQIPLQLFRSPHPPRKPIYQSTAVPRHISVGLSEMMNNVSSLVPHGSVASLPEASQRGGEQAESMLLSSLSFSSLACRRNKYLQSQLGLANLQNTSCGNVVALSIGTSKVLCVLDSGVLEFYRYSTSEAAKAALTATAKLKSDSVKLPNPSTVPRGQALTTMSDLISFDDLEHEGAPGPSITSPDPIVSIFTKFIEDFGVVIDFKKELFHFDVIPRIPLRKNMSSTLGIDFNSSEFYSAGNIEEFRRRGRHCLSPVEANCALVHITPNRKLVLSAGHSDGSVCIRQVDSRTGGLPYGADFSAHRHRVVSLATDCITGSESVVIASADGQGQVLVWTVFQNISPAGSPTSFGVSRRPQKIFRFSPAININVDISWNMGLVCAAADLKISLFSMERDELVRCLSLTKCFNRKYDATISPNSDVPNQNISLTRIEVTRTRDFDLDCCSEAYIRRVCLSDEGFVVAHVDAIFSVEQANESRSTSTILSLSLSGNVTGYFKSPSDVSLMYTPGKGNLVVIGTVAGGVLVLRACNLETIFSYYPHLQCRALFSPTISTTNPSLSASDKLSSSESTVVAPAAILCAQFGPDHRHPSVLCVSTSNGEIFIKPLPDFIRWERTRSPSALAQLVSVPLQAVRGTIQQAQNLGVWTSEQAESLAQNARSFADEAIGELKKINRSSIMKGVGSFFGMKK